MPGVRKALQPTPNPGVSLRYTPLFRSADLRRVRGHQHLQQEAGRIGPNGTNHGHSACDMHRIGESGLLLRILAPTKGRSMVTAIYFCLHGLFDGTHAAVCVVAPGGCG